ncbi:MAG: hypothetical protein R3C02_24670, partial [Planctomycetaceae bacterium]
MMNCHCGLSLKNVIAGLSLFVLTGMVGAAEPIIIEVKPDLHRGAVAQRKLIDDFIERVGEMSVEEAEDALGNNEVTVSRAGMTQSLTEGLNQFACHLSDRRVAKIYSAYLEMDQTKASHRANALFDRWFEVHKKRLNQVVTFYLKSGGFEMSIGLEESGYACSASIFLMTRFSEPEKVAEAFEKWTNAVEPVMDLTRDDRIPIHPFGNTPLPDSLLIVNCCLATLQTHLDKLEFGLAVQTQLGISEFADLSTAPFVAWDAHTNPFDFT